MWRRLGDDKQGIKGMRGIRSMSELRKSEGWERVKRVHEHMAVQLIELLEI